MIKSKIIMSILTVALSVSIFTGCSTGKIVTPRESSNPSENPAPNKFNYSDSIDENGFWSNVTALDCVELTQYTGISIPSNIHTINDEFIQTKVNSILENYKKQYQITDRAVEAGDTVNMDYVGSIDGVEFEGGSTKGAGTDVTIGVTSYIDDFLEQLIGHTPGESFDVEVTFPEDYGVEELNGKDAVFAVTLNYIIESVLPELSDEFVAENLSAQYGWNTVNEMETEIRDAMKSDAVSGYIQEHLLENVKIKSLPDSLLKYQQNSMVQYFQDNADSYNMEINDFLSTYVGVENTEKLLEMYLEDNTQAAEYYLIMQAIAEDANITVEDKDVAEYFKDIAGTEDYSVYKEAYGMPYLKMNVLNWAVMDYLEEKAVLE